METLRRTSKWNTYQAAYVKLLGCGARCANERVRCCMRGLCANTSESKCTYMPCAPAAPWAPRALPRTKVSTLA
eukprot:6998909-Alexandrium_andersonii.AAC.1